MAVPYGLLDDQANAGYIVVGISHDTPAFSVDAIESWWRREGQKRYPAAQDILLLADCGGSNGPRLRAWKWQLQQQLCNRYGLSVTVCHYPPGTSKYNPVEHRLFSEISKNWQGEPLTSVEKILKFIRSTKTTTGLRVKAHFNPKRYEKGQTVSRAQMEQLCITQHETLPCWNYTLKPAEIQSKKM